MKYVHTNSAGVQYALKCSTVEHKVGRETRSRTAYFFTRVVEGEARSEKGEFCDVPDGKEVGEAPNGVPLLRRITPPTVVIEGGPGGDSEPRNAEETGETEDTEETDETSEFAPKGSDEAEKLEEETDESGPADQQ